jgi:SRSO17 transposase
VIGMPWWCSTSQARRKSEHTAGVKRQYVGCAGRVSNAVNVVYATLATARGHALVGARPYLPREWAEDAEHRSRAKVPDDVAFKTKPQLAVDILSGLHTAGLLPLWATGDEVYGRDTSLRGFCEQHDVLTMIALAACATAAAAMRAATNTLPPPPTHPNDEPPEDPGLIPLTVAEIKRLANLVTRTGQALSHQLRWSWWRRRHQARARWFHHRTRLRRGLQPARHPTDRIRIVPDERR